MKIFFWMVVSAGLWLSSTPLLYGQTSTCERAYLVHFFDQKLVYQAFSLNQVQQGKWYPAYNELQKQARTVPDIVSKRLPKGTSTPQTQEQLDERNKIISDTLYQVFYEVMNKWGITNPYAIQNMFNYLREQQASGLTSCFGSSFIPPSAENETTTVTQTTVEEPSSEEEQKYNEYRILHYEMKPIFDRVNQEQGTEAPALKIPKVRIIQGGKVEDYY